MTNVPRVSVKRLRAFIADAFVAAGLPDDGARALGELIAEADLRGIDTHGVFRMPLYVRRIRAGGIDPGSPPNSASRRCCEAHNATNELSSPGRAGR
jgi:L-2-hydroxycarboxylate dehydrogenase (NAD+)